jgi:hypothetical protein
MCLTSCGYLETFVGRRRMLDQGRSLAGLMHLFELRAQDHLMRVGWCDQREEGALAWATLQCSLGTHLRDSRFSPALTRGEHGVNDARELTRRGDPRHLPAQSVFLSRVVLT